MSPFRLPSLGRLATACAVAVSLSILGISTASAPAGASATQNVWYACGFGGVAPGSGSGVKCVSLAKAISEATAGGASDPTATIILMPGSYCPTIIPFGYRSLDIIGAGPAAESGTGGLDGPEAGLSTFTYNDANCSPTSPAEGEVDLTAGYYFWSTVTIENVAFEPNAAAGGPSTGVYTGAGDNGEGVNLTLRNDLFEKGNEGLYYVSGYDDYQNSSVTVTNDAFIDNATGFGALGDGEIEDSLFYGNTDAGFTPVNSDFQLLNDTFTGNHEGVDLLSDSDQIFATNNIVADNSLNDTTPLDCEGVGGDIYGLWEYGGSGVNFDNLTGSSCNVGNATDIAFDDTMQNLTENGGPTPSVMPPEQARGTADASLCPSVDQRDAISSSASCDIGSVQESGTTIAQAAKPGPLSFGTVPDDRTSTESVPMSNSGGGLLGVYGAKVTGAGFSLGSDECQYAELIHVEGSSCAVDVTVAPTSKGAMTGSLEIDTTAGKVTVPLSASGGSPIYVAGAPTSVTARPGNGQVTVSWTQPAKDGGSAIDGYEVQYSTDGGATWSDVGSAAPSATSLVISDIENNLPYLFEVRADNGAGTGPWSKTTPFVVPFSPGDASTSSAPKTQTVPYGSSTTLQTVLMDKTHNTPESGAPVELWSSPNGSAPWTEAVPDATTGTSGKASMKVTPSKNTHYVWVYLGTTSEDPAVSSIGTVSVAQVVQIALTKTSIAKGVTTTLYGAVSPKEVGKTVVLEERQSGVWKKTTRQATIKEQTLPDGKTAAGYVLSFSSGTAGSYVLRVESAATFSNAAGVSKAVTLTVT